MDAPQRGEPRDMVVPDRVALLPEAGDGRVELAVLHSTTALSTRPDQAGTITGDLYASPGPIKKCRGHMLDRGPGTSSAG